MEYSVIALQVILAIGLFNVWLVRFSKITPYRGGTARTMTEEFSAYGLPKWSPYFIGTLKVGIGLSLIAGIWLPTIVLPASALLCVLMVGALLMHLKVRDPIKKSIPALLMLAMSTSVALLTQMAQHQ